MFALTLYNKVVEISEKIYEPNYCYQVRGLKAHKVLKSGEWTHTYLFLDEITKTTQTLEEMCDAFMVVKIGFNIPLAIYPTLEQAKRCAKEYEDKSIDVRVYGGIWNSNGFTYLATNREWGFVIYE